MEKEKFSPLETLGGIYQIAKEKEFYSAFSQYIHSKENDYFWEYFNDKKYRISDNLISYRIANHWEKENILDVKQSDGGWRKYSLMDIVWLIIIKKLRHFGLGLEEIRKVKKTLTASYEQCEYGELEFYTALAYINKTPVSILIFSDFKAEVATAYEVIGSSDKYGILDHIKIDLNLILQNIFPEKNFKPIYQNFIEISDEQKMIWEKIKEKEVEEITISVKNGVPVSMIYTVSEPTNSNVGQLKNKNAHQNITLTQHKGKTTAIKRKVSKKFKSDEE